jgi:hypothetical protein
VTRQEGLGSNVIFALAVGPEGSLWAATEEGVSRIREGNDELSITTFSALDGLPRIENAPDPQANGRAAQVRDVAVGPDGTVWLATDRGLFRIVHQGGVVQGSIVGRTGQPVVGADVTVAGTPFRAVTDAAGSFVLTNLPPGPARLEVEGSRAVGGPFGVVVRQVTVVAGEQPLGRVVLPPPGPLQLLQVAGDQQTAVVGHALSQPLVVAVRHAQGQPVAGISVTFQVAPGHGTVSPGQVPTGPDGQAATTVTLGTGAGAIAVQALVDGLTPVQFSATGVADRETARLIPVSGYRQVGAPGQVLPIPLVVRLRDQFLNPVVGEPVTGVVQGDGVLLASTTAGPFPLQLQQANPGPPVTVLTDAQGQAAFRLRAGASGETIVTEVVAPQLPQAGSVPFLTLDRPAGLAVEAAGSLVVGDEGLGAVLRVNPITGDRAIISGCAAVDSGGRCVGEIIGAGPRFLTPVGIVVEAAGSLVVGDVGLGAVLRVDPFTGDRVIVSTGAE